MNDTGSSIGTTVTDRPLPDDDTMWSLLALARGVWSRTDNGVLEMAVPDETAPDGVRWHAVTGEQIDDLEGRGWIVLVGEDEVEGSDTGVYWLNRWLAKQVKRFGRRARRR